MHATLYYKKKKKKKSECMAIVYYVVGIREYRQQLASKAITFTSGLLQLQREQKRKEKKKDPPAVDPYLFNGFPMLGYHVQMKGQEVDESRQAGFQMLTRTPVGGGETYHI